MAKHFVALVAAERLAFAAEELGDVVAVCTQQILRRHVVIERGDREDEIVFGDEVLAQSHHCRLNTGNELAAQPFRLAGEARALVPVEPLPHEVRPR